MLPVSDAVKNLFRDGQSHNYSMTIYVGSALYFPHDENNKITDEQIKAESASLSETLFSGEKLKFGIVSASCLQVTLIGVETNLKGKYIDVVLTYDNNDLPYGRFYVESYEKKTYSTERTLTAYDYTYFLGVSGKDKFEDMYAQYIQHGTYDMSTAISVCESTFEYLGLQYTPFTSATSYAFNMFLPEQMTLATMCEWMGELYHGWWRSDRYGVMHFLQIDMSATPEQIDTMRPRTCEYSSAPIGTFTGIEFNFYTDKYETILYGTDENPYKMTPANPFLINHSADIETIGAALLAAFNNISYIPNKINFEGRPYLECGDMYVFTTDDDTETPQTITAPIVQQTIKGIGALTTTTKASGASYAENDNSTNIVTQSEQLAETQQTVTELKDRMVTAENTLLYYILPTVVDIPAFNDYSCEVQWSFRTLFSKDEIHCSVHSMFCVTVDTDFIEVPETVPLPHPDDYDRTKEFYDCDIIISLSLSKWDDAQGEVSGRGTGAKLWTETATLDGQRVMILDVLFKELEEDTEYFAVLKIRGHNGDIT